MTSADRADFTPQHTPEPWIASNHDVRAVGPYGPQQTVAVTWAGERTAPANARRIVAAVNACAGLSNESLEAGAVAAAVEALHDGLGHFESIMLRIEGGAKIYPADRAALDARFRQMRAALALVDAGGQP